MKVATARTLIEHYDAVVRRAWARFHELIAKHLERSERVRPWRPIFVHHGGAPTSETAANER